MKGADVCKSVHDLDPFEGGGVGGMTWQGGGGTT